MQENKNFIKRGGFEIMEKEFNLKEKRKVLINLMFMATPEGSSMISRMFIKLITDFSKVIESQDKEFIRLLKEKRKKVKFGYKIKGSNKVHEGTEEVISLEEIDKLSGFKDV